MVDARTWWLRAKEAADSGRPLAGLRCCSKALALLDQQPPDTELRIRILLTLSNLRSQLGEIDVALEILGTAERLAPGHAPSVMAARGLLLVREGRPDQALVDLDAAVAGLNGRYSLDLGSTLLNRGVLHMNAGRLRLAQQDTAGAEQIGTRVGNDNLVFMARYNLGYIRFLAGDLPGALDAMGAANRSAPADAVGVPALDRARILMSAGLITEARESLDLAIGVFTRHRAEGDLIDALLVAAELDLVAADPDSARRNARRAEGICRRRGHLAAALLAQLLRLRADAAALLPWELRSPAAAGGRVASGRVAQDAHARALLLADQLAELGLRDEARTARLVAAECSLALGDPLAAQEAASQAAHTQRRPPIAGRLHSRLVVARIALADGRRGVAQANIRRGLDDLADFQARFGSQDLQSAAAVHGAGLARLGLATAVQTGSPAAILQWIERGRAVTTRLPAVRPNEDPELATGLASLRRSVAEFRAATLTGQRSPALEREITQLRQRIRSRAWTIGGGGRARRPPALTAVQRYLQEHDPHGAVVAFFHAEGQQRALVITSGRAAHRALTSRASVDDALTRLTADLDLLAAQRISPMVRSVAARSLRTGMSRLSAMLVDPIADLIDSGNLRIAAVGRLATAPWSALPGLRGRAVSLTASVTAALAPPVLTPAHAAGVLAVAGPDVRGGIAEVEAVGAMHETAVTLTGAAATGSAVLQQVPADGLLHIAAHGHHVPESPLFSAVLLADGPLFGYDIAPNPALPSQVVLSSCDVGRSADRPGGEPLGLAAALLRSGVSTVIAGVSRISDTVAVTVMTAYHSRLLAGDPPAVALATALESAESEPAPFTCFGAGF